MSEQGDGIQNKSPARGFSWSSLDPIKDVRKVVALCLAGAVFLSIGLLSQVVRDKVVDAWGWIRSPSSSVPPKVLAVFPVSSTSEPMVAGINPDVADLVPGKNWKIELLREDGLEATERDLMNRLRKKDEDVVLVVGHERSTTVKFLNERVYESEVFTEGGGAIPLILPAATNPEITRSPSGGHKHILRLPATDDKQVDRLVSFLEHLTPTPSRVVVVVDTSNAEYSNYIARELIARVPGVVDSMGINIHSSGFSPERFLGPEPDVIVFVGMEIEAGIFLRRIAAHPNVPLGPNGLRLLFTDGVAGVTFKRVTDEVLEKGEAVYLSGPFPAEVEKGKEMKFPTYEAYAALARMIASELLITAEQRGGVTRENVLKVLQEAYGSKREFTYNKVVRAQFDSNGDNILGRMHIFDIGKLVTHHSAQCTCE